MSKNVFLYERDSKGNQESISNQDNKLKGYVNELFEDANIKIYVDQCSLNDECKALKQLIKDLQNEKVDWVITTNSNRFYRMNYEDGKQRLLNILTDINKNGTNIAFIDNSIQLKNEEQIFKYISGWN